jgi:precorrin-2 dehydrogenase / sirohydrochlorin ferrochelatase
VSGEAQRDEVAGPTGLAILPVGLRFDGRLVLVVGAGAIAARKARALVDAGARLRVVAPQWSSQMEAVPVHDGRRRAYEPTDLDGVWFVVTATGIPRVDGAVFDDAQARRIWCNAADDPQHCSVILPAVARRGPVSVAVSTGGRSPAVASWLRRRVEELLDDGVDEVLEAAVRVRGRLRSAGRPTEVPGWAEVLDRDGAQLGREGAVDELERRLWQAVAPPGGDPSPER